MPGSPEKNTENFTPDVTPPGPPKDESGSLAATSIISCYEMERTNHNAEYYCEIGTDNA